MMATDIGRGSFLVNLMMKAGGLLRITRNMSQGAATSLLCTLLDHAWLRGQYWCASRVSCPRDSPQFVLSVTSKQVITVAVSVNAEILHRHVFLSDCQS